MVLGRPIAVFFVSKLDKFAVFNQLCSCYVIKELVHAFSCAYIELWMHLGSLESTQKARVALGYRLEQLLRFFRARQTSRVHP